MVVIKTTVKPVKEVAVPELISYEGVSVAEELEKVSETIEAELAAAPVATEAEGK